MPQLQFFKLGRQVVRLVHDTHGQKHNFVSNICSPPPNLFTTYFPLDSINIRIIGSYDGYLLYVCMQLADLETLKQSSRLVHYCATPLLFDPVFRQQIQADQQGKPEGKVKTWRDPSSVDS